MRLGDDHASVLDAIRRSDKGAVLVLDEAGKPRRWVGPADLQRADGQALDQVGLPPEAVVEPQATLNDALNELITANYSVAIVVDSAGAYQGIVDIDHINEAIRTMRSDARARSREGLYDDSPDGDAGRAV